MSVVNFFPALNLKISIVVTIQSASSNNFSSFFSVKGATDVAKKKPHHFYLQATRTGYYIARPLVAAHSCTVHRPPPSNFALGGGTFLRLENENK